MFKNPIPHIMDPENRWRLLFALLAAVNAAVFSHYVFCDTVITTDENSYIFQAYSFSEGRIAREPPPLPEVFEHEMIIMDPSAGWLSRYSPGHALWLMPGAWLHMPRLMVFLAAALSILVLGAAANRLDIHPLFVPLLLLLSPFYQFMYGTMLSHTSGLPAAALMLWAYLRWHTDDHRGRGILFPALTGIFWGWLFLNRTYTALLIGLPFGIDSLIQLARQRNRRALTGTLLFAGSAFFMILLYMGYNHLAVGDARTPTYLFYEPSENLGFGLRRTQTAASTVHHTFERGWSILMDHLHDLNTWIFGIPGSLYILLALTAAGRRKRWSPLLFCATACVWLGYVAFWYQGIPEVGPLYYFETLPFMIMLAASGLERIRRAWPQHPWMSRGLLILFFILNAGFSLRFALQHGRELHRECTYEGYVMDRIREAPPSSVVIVEDMPEPLMGEAVFNPRGLDSDPLVVRSLYDDNFIIARLFPERKPWIIRKEKWPDIQPLDFPEKPIRIRDEGHSTRHETGRNETIGNERVRAAHADRDAPGWLSYAQYHYLPPGTYCAVLELEVHNAEPEHPVHVEIASDCGQRLLAVQDLTETSTNFIHRFTFTADNIIQVEPRIRYDGSGDVYLRTFEITEQPPSAE